MSRAHHRTAAAGLVATLSLLSATAFAGDGVRQLSQAQAAQSGFPLVVSEPGSYILTSNLTVDPQSPPTAIIEIAAGDVTLDLNGFVLTGSRNEFGVAITGNDPGSVVVRNGAIRQVTHGVRYAAQNNNRLTRCEALRVSDATDIGISLQRGEVIGSTVERFGNQGINISRGEVTGCNVYDGVGIGSVTGIFTGRTARIQRNTIHIAGLGIFAQGAVISDNTIEIDPGANQSGGISAGLGSSVTGNTVRIFAAGTGVSCDRGVAKGNSIVVQANDPAAVGLSMTAGGLAAENSVHVIGQGLAARFGTDALTEKAVSLDGNRFFGDVEGVSGVGGGLSTRGKPISGNLINGVVIGN